jgi:hypothetical protein
MNPLLVSKLRTWRILPGVSLLMLCSVPWFLLPAQSLQLTSCRWAIDDRGEFVTITYDLVSKANEPCAVEVAIRQRENPRFDESPSSDQIIGHLGSNVAPGKNRKILWFVAGDPLRTLPGYGWQILLVAKGRKTGERTSALTNLGSFAPPRLKIETIRLEQSAGQEALRAGNSARLSCRITNLGRGNAVGVRILAGSLSDPGVHCDSLGTLRYNFAPGFGRILEFPIAADDSVRTRIARLQLYAVDSVNSSADTAEIPIPLLRKPLPLLRIREVSYGPPGDRVTQPFKPGAVLFRGDTTKIVARVANDGSGDGDSVRLNVRIEGENHHVFYAYPYRPVMVRLLSVSKDGAFSSGADLPAGKFDIPYFRVYVGEDFPGDSLVMTIDVTERNPECAISHRVVFSVRDRNERLERMVARHLRAGQVDSAIEICQKAVTMTPDSVMPRLLLAGLLEKRGDKAGALPQYIEAMNAGDESARKWVEANALSTPFWQISSRVSSTDIFGGVPLPVVVGFTRLSSGSGKDYFKDLHEALKESRLPRFNFLSSSSMETLCDRLRSGSPAIMDPAILKSLAENPAQKVAYIVHGDIVDTKLGAFALKITRTVDGKTLFNHKFMNTDKSTGVKDAAAYFRSLQIPVYREQKSYQLQRPDGSR